VLKTTRRLLDDKGQSLSGSPTVYDSRVAAETMEKLVLRANQIPYTLHNRRARLDVTATDPPGPGLLPSEGLLIVSTSSGVKIGRLLRLHHRKITLFPRRCKATLDGGRKLVEVVSCEELS
jgi:hypothetical protein